MEGYKADSSATYNIIEASKFTDSKRIGRARAIRLTSIFKD